MSIRLRQICLVAEKLAPALDDLQAIFGLQVCFVDPGVGVWGLENSLLPLGNDFLEVVAPKSGRADDATAAGRYLMRRGGDGGYMVICQCDAHATQLACRQRALDLGVRIAFEHESRVYHALQLHPRDTGGSFFEIDWDARQEPEGAWEPAGGSAAGPSGWTSARRTDVVRGFAGVEIQSPDPEALAQKWCAIVDRPVGKDAQGHPQLALDNVPVRFVPDSDGRGEGLGGVDLHVADRARLLRAADARGCRVSDEQVLVCGTRFRLV